MLKFSVITPSLNRADMLEACIQNVLGQNYPNFEHIVVDGGSTDGTLELLGKYGHVRVLGGPDRGMYDALNKGIAISTGDIITFLNTDDLYGEDIFQAVAGAFELQETSAVAGKALVFQVLDGSREILSQYSPADTDLMECSTIGSNYFNAWFFHRSVFDLIGTFDAGYRIAGDREFMFRFALTGLKYVTIDKITYQYFQHDASLTFDDDIVKRQKSAEEHLKMTGFYLRDQRVSQQVRNLLKELRSRVALEMSIRFLKARNFGNMFDYVLVGMDNNVFWLPRFVRTVFRKQKRL